MLAVTLLTATSAQGQSDAESRFLAAEGLFRSGQLAEAKVHYEELLASFPRARYPDLDWRAAARVRLGDLTWRSGSWREAGAAYVDVIELEAPSAWQARARLRLAGIALIDADVPGALDLLQRIVGAAADEADPGAAAGARRLLTLIERFHLRAAQGRAPYARASVFNAGTTLDRPLAVAVGTDGSLLIVDEGEPAVVLKDPSREQASRLPYNAHTRPWWGVDGLPYLPTRKAGVIALGGTRVGFMAADRGGSAPLKELEAGVRTPDGAWFLLDGNPRRVVHFGPDGAYRGVATTATEQPVDVATDMAGRVYVLDRTGPRVSRFLPDGSRDGVIVSAAWRRPEALEIDRLGNVYVLDRDARTIDIFGPDGQRLYRLGPGLPGAIELRGPRDLTVDEAGRIFVADRSSRNVVVIE